jgi:hypothetical protein
LEAQTKPTEELVMTTLTAPRTLLRLFAFVLAADVLGAIVAVAGGLEGAGTAVVSGTPINAPAPFVAVQALALLAAARTADRRAAVPTALLALLCGVSVASGFGDGSYAASLSVLERAVQGAVVAGTAALGLAALARAVRAARRAPVTA